MRYGGNIRKYDTANGIGVRTSIFVTGCSHNCFNCFNADYQSFSHGNMWTKMETDLVIKYMQNKHVSGLSILGGEPMQNVPELTNIVREIKKHTDKNIWVWSGFTYENILLDKDKTDLLKLCDVLVDGQFIQAKKDLTLAFRGSSNQRVIDVKRSLKSNKIVLYLD